MTGKFFVWPALRRRTYFSASKDPNIRNGGNNVIHRMKSLIYRTDKRGSVSGRLARLVEDELPRMSLNEVVESAYLLARLTRQDGGILAPGLSVTILQRLANNLDALDRPALTQVLQLCSLAVSRNRVNAGEQQSVDLLGLRRQTVQRIMDGLTRRFSDIPTPGLSVIVSALSRQYEPWMDSFFLLVCDNVSSRIRICLSRDASSTSNFLRRSDLLRIVPYLHLVFQQNQLAAPPGEFVAASLSLYSGFAHEATFEHFALFVRVLGKPGAASISCSEEIRLILDYMQTIPVEDLTVLDACRLVEGAWNLAGGCSKDFLSYLPRRPKAEWTMHALEQFARVAKFVKSEEQFSLYFNQLKQARLSPRSARTILVELAKVSTIPSKLGKLRQSPKVGSDSER